jgi:hypothetical protein
MRFEVVAMIKPSLQSRIGFPRKPLSKVGWAGWGEGILVDLTKHIYSPERWGRVQYLTAAHYG